MRINAALAVSAIVIFMCITGVGAAAADKEFIKSITPEQSGLEIVVPSDGLPGEVETQDANNNLDVVRHDGRVFLAFRTAPSHFASDKTEIFVVSSDDQSHWQFEMKYHKGTDLREPRFLSYDGKLFLYIAVLGRNVYDFEPKGMLVTEYKGPGEWTEPEEILEKGFIPWRTKTVDGVPYMLAYRGGENIYEFMEDSYEELHWLTTEDGRNWTAVAPGRPVVHKGGCSEADFEFAGDGAVIAVCRNELGDDEGFGSKICRAEPDSPGDWNCRHDPKKYDSPLIFKHDGNIFLIGRRNISRSGRFDLTKKGKKPNRKNAIPFQLDYWKRPKRCSLWYVDPLRLDVTFIDDLPSKGDTCFPGIVKMSDNEYMVYNYTSPLDGPDVSWNRGQQGKTLIYRILLSFHE